MKKLVRSLQIVVVLLTFLVIPAAFGQSIETPTQLVNDGFLTYGVAATFPPFEYKQGDKLVGFDIEFGEAIAEKLGLKTRVLNMEFKGLIPALQGKRIDIINSAMYIKPERAEQVDFVAAGKSEPVGLGGEVAFVGCSIGNSAAARCPATAG